MKNSASSEYGLTGYPLGHSFSEKYFTEKFDNEGTDATYRLFPLHDLKMFPALLAEHPRLKGLNVTIPYKEEIFKYLDSVSPEAAEIGAVNVIKITHEHSGSLNTPAGEIRLEGFNSDCYGFMHSLEPLLTSGMNKALILGTGGASKAVAHALRMLGISYTKVSRNPKDNELAYKDLTQRIILNNLLIVNTTPLGTFPNTEEAPDIPYRFLTPRHLCYDLVYNPGTTKFMRLAAEYGAGTKNGLEMLHLQADRAWEIWNE